MTKLNETCDVVPDSIRAGASLEPPTPVADLVAKLRTAVSDSEAYFKHEVEMLVFHMNEEFNLIRGKIDYIAERLASANPKE